jgi:hypothetical protein
MVENIEHFIRNNLWILTDFIPAVYKNKEIKKKNLKDII